MAIIDDPLSFGNLFRPRSSAIYPTPEEEEALLGELGRSTLGGLAYVGSVLDKPGRAVRGVLSGLSGGDWDGGLLNLIPFSDALGITDTEAITGRDLLEQWGVLAPNQSGFQPIDNPADALGDVAGFAAGVLLDPTTYMTLGASALTRGAGQAAKLAGDLAPALRGADDALKIGAREAGLRTGQRNLIGFGLPFMDPVAGIGARADDAVQTLDYLKGLSPDDLAATRTLPERIAHGMDVAGEWARYGNLPFTGFSPGRAAAGLFQKASKSTYGRPAQIAAQAMTEAESLARESALKDAIANYQALGALGLDDDVQFRLLSKAVEGVPLDDADLALLGDNAGAFGEIVQRMRAGEREVFDQLRATGFNINELTPENMDYFSRYLSESAGRASGGRLFPREFQSALHRDPALRDIPRHLLNDLAEGRIDLNTLLEVNMGPAALEALSTQRKNVQEMLANAQAYGNWHPLDVYFGGPGLETAELVRRANNEVADLTRRLAIPEAISKKNLDLIKGPLYGDPQRDYARYLAQGRQAIEANRGVVEFLRKYASTSIGPGQQSLGGVLRKLGFGGEQAITDTEVVKSLTKLVPGIEGANAESIVKLLDTFGVDQSIGDDAVRMIKGLTMPEALQPIADVWDGFTSAFKIGQTIPWPSFHTRNMATGLWQNLVGGALDPREYRSAYRLLRGDSVDAVLDHPLVKAQGITDPKAASDFLRGQFYAHNVAGQSFMNEITGRFVPPTENFAGHIPGEAGAELSFTGIGAAAREGFQSAEGSNRIVRGLKGALQGGVAAGHRAGNLVEAWNRAAGWLALTKQGFSPREAAAKVRALHVDYANLSDIERGVMRRFVPFYAWSRGMLPEVLRELAERPGGLTGQAAQLAGSIRDGQEAFLPEYLQGGLGIPLTGEDASGTQTFLTNLDLPVESVFESLHTGPGALQQTGMDLLGMTNPLIKGPLEVMLGKQFFTGRDLRDLESPIGRLISNLGITDQPPDVPLLVDQVASNLPTSRALSTAGQLAQGVAGRKTLTELATNLLTGARVSDVDLAKHREIAARELAGEMLRGDEGVKAFESIYVTPEWLAQATPREKQLYGLIRSISARRQKQQGQTR